MIIAAVGKLKHCSHRSSSLLSHLHSIPPTSISLFLLPPFFLSFSIGLGKLEFSVQVLTTGHWPTYKVYDNINLPPAMLKCTQVRQAMQLICVFMRYHRSACIECSCCCFWWVFVVLCLRQVSDAASILWVVSGPAHDFFVVLFVFIGHVSVLTWPLCLHVLPVLQSILLPTLRPSRHLIPHPTSHITCHHILQNNNYIRCTRSTMT